MVSIVIPIYNVEKYVEKCLETVINQTYKNLEIIIINDGSTDGSGEICRRISENDKRIIYLEKENEGLGPTRNLGIHMAKGEYILFIDSDDWWEYNTVERLLSAAKEYNADIVYMNFYFSEYINGELVERPHIRHYLMDGAVDAKENFEILFDNDARMWSKLFHRSLFIDNDIFMPAHPYEDLPVMPLLAMCAVRVCQVKDCLYHYYYERPNNIIGNEKNKKYIFESIKELHYEFCRRGWDVKYKEPLRDYILGMSKFALNEMRGDKQDYMRMVKELYPDYDYKLNLKAIIMGSYNSLVIMRNVVFLNTQIKEHYMFSSLIGIMSKNQHIRQEVDHVNPFRKSMVNKDIHKAFCREIGVNLAEIDFLVIDFLEEIEDIIKVGESYYTDSVAHKQTDAYTGLASERITILDERREGLWEEKCLEFIKKIKLSFKPQQVILLRQKLCTNYGTDPQHLKSFDNIEELEKINGILDGYYDFFEKNFSGVKVVLTETGSSTYTYEFTKYGCDPRYYNGIQYKEISERIKLII